MQKILCLGAGNMVSAIIPNFVKAAEQAQFSFYTPSKTKAEKLATLVGGEFLAELPNDLRCFDLIILGFKPQSFLEIAKDLKSRLSRDSHVISILAGTRIEKIKDALGVSKVTRIMPNTPAKYALGASIVSFSGDVPTIDQDLISSMVNSIGVSINCSEEELEIATPFSGSGPAYFFLLTELMSNDLMERGFSKEDAEKLCRQTFIGSAKLLAESGLGADELRQKVTSKGGVTHAAVERLKELGIQSHLKSAIDNAIKRNEELGK